ncbi:methylated-DNA--[protein]-cysteine S-methyltransferase [Sporolituus thermophilus]|uniref:methylated-DNA--[protein]-cysteine S-methyltransferase n=1 Tax=Sporolituus thermophilus DSM 23256 TaxID=1123285 RepID=A0A1G7MMU6_9FIRM|nr:methylated-DNA--[protein]-cysteine S-methyltransferase [Sporolituus thermophilus]SDF62936.1 methylated-DNA-[protein]-cysteine S-methyltransferase [Sporolituus thermophilus DSM 23256]
MTKVYNLFTTEWGHMAAVWSDSGLWELSFPRPDAAAALADLTTPDLTEGEAHPLLAELAGQLKVYFRGYPAVFTVPVDWRGYTPFQAAVLRYTAGIAFGEVRTYGEVAKAVGAPKAARAVGGALHRNRTPIVIPCHRVIGADGNLTGFGGGLELKKALLLLEQAGQGDTCITGTLALNKSIFE